MSTLRNLKQETFSTSALSMSPLLFPVHNHLLCLADVEGEVVSLAPRLLVMRSRMVVLSANEATKSYMSSGYRRGLSTQPRGAPVLRVSAEEVRPAIFTTWGLPARKSRILSCNLQKALSCIYILYPGGRGRCTVRALASSVDLLGWYAN